MKKTYIIFHNHCFDGFTSAALAKLYFDHKKEEIEFLPFSYGQFFPQIFNSRIYLLDFSFKKEYIIKLLEMNNQIIIIDHHISALNDLETLKHENLTKIFDMNECGSSLVNNYFFKQREFELVKYVKDIDLWQWKFENTKYVSSYLSSIKFDLNNYYNLLCDFKEQEIITKGRVIYEYNQTLIENFSKPTSIFQIDDLRIPMFNVSPNLTSSLCNYYLEKNDSLVCGNFNKTSRGFSISLRSKKEFDCSKISEKFKGGGHKQASGFLLSNEELLKYISNIE